ncbi:MAG: metallopeptidase family protein [bacterium]
MTMSEREFEHIAAEEWKRMPERFSDKVANVALLIENEVDAETRQLEGLGEGETLLGLYRGIPLVERGSEYGVGVTLPDTITLYRLPLLEEAHEMGGDFPEAVRRAIRETLWHEVGHYFGLSEQGVNEREADGTNRFAH